MQGTTLLLVSQQLALQQALDVVANNVANADTTGFKSENIAFNSYLMPTHSQNKPNEKLVFAINRGTYRDTTNGPIVSTGNPLDLAIQGDGYFAVQAPDGSTLYTRAGAFQINSQGQLATLSGLPVVGDGGQPISVPDTTTDINLSGDGFVTVKSDNGTDLAQLGKVSLVKFANEQDMQAQGGGLYTTSQTPVPSGAEIMQGAIEQSNVKPIQEMTQMIQIMRSYEQASNMINQENARRDDAVAKLSKTTT